MDLFGCTSSIPQGHSPIHLIAVNSQTLAKVSPLTPAQKNWISQQRFSAKHGTLIVIPDSNGHIQSVLFGWNQTANIWDFASIIQALPPGTYELHSLIGSLNLFAMAKVWGLSCYEFTRYRLAKKNNPSLLVSALSKNNSSLLTYYSMPLIKSKTGSIPLQKILAHLISATSATLWQNVTMPVSKKWLAMIS
jgi:hypothetical protein